ncbi:hypothetical protein ACFLX7_02270 [Chloroflexota bacterium]
MKKEMYRFGMAVVLAAVLVLGIIGLVDSYSEVGVTRGVEIDELTPLVSDLAQIPQSVIEDATILGEELFGEHQDKADYFVDQLLITYLEAKDKDLVVIFNPGGWGWSLLEASEQWQSIFAGIESVFDDKGYTLLWLDYQRTADNLLGCLDESVQMMTDYSSKVHNLVSRVEFLTDNIPDLRVIITGESNGAVIAGGAMNILEDNRQVYSIQTGPPFWHETAGLDRTLVITDNGIIPDSFSRGDFMTMFWGNIRALFGMSQPEDESGNILYYVKAPGHDYQWCYPGVGPAITGFLERNFQAGW